MIVSLSAGKADILWRRQNCLNLEIPAAYVALVEGAKASLRRSSKLTSLQIVLRIPGVAIGLGFSCGARA